jgi:hypothetical protein
VSLIDGLATGYNRKNDVIVPIDASVKPIGTLEALDRAFLVIMSPLPGIVGTKDDISEGVSDGISDIISEGESDCKSDGISDGASDGTLN